MTKLYELVAVDRGHGHYGPFGVRYDGMVMVEGIKNEEFAAYVVKACNAMAEHGWQPIEKAPKNGQSILITTNAHSDGVVIASWFKYNGKEAFRDWDADPHFPTHWMPLPKPPAPTCDDRSSGRTDSEIA